MFHFCQKIHPTELPETVGVRWRPLQAVELLRLLRASAHEKGARQQRAQRLGHWSLSCFVVLSFAVLVE